MLGCTTTINITIIGKMKYYMVVCPCALLPIKSYLVCHTRGPGVVWKVSYQSLPHKPSAQAQHDPDNIGRCNPKPQPGNGCCNENANSQLEKKKHKNVVLYGELGTDQDHTLHPRHAEMRHKLIIAVLFISI
jgi:hypothetical protein